ncbi:hypothetical protein SAMN05720781_1178 [Fibrobacter sp. UWT3]|uniref:hypothetical protein n=1 Tax=Fibrobacter sp. UWT3 TaxID=1896225 RepID=UPI000BC80FE0|nr:hypothetical protein [Fibrobacter sp. UWT3]SOE56918.1 hypothetical protein SAMN05720781_1178 [Fibrobacter sp. UWT3]
MRLLVTIFLLLVCASGAFATHVAVLETGVDPAVKKKVTLSDRQYLTNVLREEAVKQLPAEDGYTIMTRENISEMLPPGKAIEDCEGTCLAETGRNISADFVCQARVSSFGSKLALSAEIYETAGNKLVASFNGNGKNVEALLKVIKENAPDFFGKVKSNRDAGSGDINKSGSGGIGDAGSLDPDANEDAEEEADKVKVARAKDVQFDDDDDDDMPRSNKPINEVPTVKNTQNRVWIRWGLISGGSVLLTTGLVLAAFAGEEDEYEMDYDTLEMKKKKGDDGTLQFGIGIALSIIGAAGIVVGFCF